MDPFSILPSLVQTEIFVHLQSDIGVKYRQIEMWKTMELPDTLDLEQLEALWHIISRMIIVIEDYVSKATSECPPLAYLGTLDLLNGSGSYFKGQRLDTTAVRFSSLTGASSQRQLKETENNPEDDEVITYSARDIIYLHGSCCLSLHGIQLRTYRQRAWGLFDDDRLYPKHVTHFPTLNDIQQIEKAFLNRAWLDAELEIRRGWSQTWQEYWFLRMPEPPGKCYDERDDEVAIDGYLGPRGRFFRACSEKLPDIGE
ncbi:hypothetical protein FOC4_g10002548 [Fusarium odoratissimum]|uniref:Uncharacterized protein n=2 Tax=Fusarium oxysporum species complex TaxID=171631 RepID=N1S6H8_FUSC4|nr:hypothetical protein FOC4_g10002548 [Fusarium odoratissimum]TXB97144.1 hypothetical protein FocTR4_00011110 [Fusarium oxysporum f. sp. cubense]